MAKNIYIGVDNVARKVKQPNIGVDGVARKVKSGFIGVGNVSRQFFSGGTPLSALSVGTVVKLNESGAVKDYIIVNQGIPSGSSLYDASCNGTWLLRKDAIEQLPWNSAGTNVLEDSSIHTWLNANMLSKYDGNIQNTIKQVKIPYRMGGGKGADQSGSNGLSCKVFLLSANEVGATASYNLPNDGALLSYFESGVSASAKSKRITYYTYPNGNTAVIRWFLRSPVVNNTQFVWTVDGTGAFETYDMYAGESNGIRPALIMPFETLIGDSMNIIAS